MIKKLSLLIIYLLILILTILPIILISIILFFTQGRPIFFWSDRIGKNKKIFKMPKFRSMSNNAPLLASHLLEEPDTKITFIGKILRKYSLDELPQIISLFQGNMSIVGPRPALLSQKELLLERKKNGSIFCRPGLTGLAQINGYNNMPFKEKAKSYGLDFKGYATQASFFDYDLDGDLDVFLLNHSTNPNQNYGKGTSRNIINEASGDKLFENKDGYYVNVSEASGIFQSKIGYGLGVSVSDINNDGLPDIYVTNDFFENDYLYLNQGDKTFNEVIHQENQSIGHTTHYSMGNSIADINNDGYNDILSVDMLPEDLETYKTSGTEFNYQIYHNYLKNGYAPQYMQNTLQLNNGNGSFSETGYLSGISATEWYRKA